jgi:hypothetical protein
MNRYYLFIEKEKIIGFSKNKISSKDYETVEVITDTTLTADNIKGYKYQNGKLVYNEEEYYNILKNQTIENLRDQRRKECFNIINRGQLWYNKLTEQQILELDI